jgi:flagellar basal body-associated protein FliL
MMMMMMMMMMMIMMIMMMMMMEEEEEEEEEEEVNMMKIKLYADTTTISSFTGTQHYMRFCVVLN